MYPSTPATSKTITTRRGGGVVDAPVSESEDRRAVLCGRIRIENIPFVSRVLPSIAPWYDVCKQNVSKSGPHIGPRYAPVSPITLRFRSYALIQKTYSVCVRCKSGLPLCNSDGKFNSPCTGDTE